MTTDEQRPNNRALLICLALFILGGIALVVYGIAMDAKKAEAELALHRYDFELIESWQGNYRVMEAVKSKDFDKEELAAMYEGQTVELNQYKNVVVSITEDMVQLNQEIALDY